MVGTVIVLVIVFTAIIFAIIKIAKDSSKGKCTGCPYAGTCQKTSCPSSERK